MSSSFVLPEHCHAMVVKRFVMVLLFRGGEKRGIRSGGSLDDLFVYYFMKEQ